MDAQSASLHKNIWAPMSSLRALAKGAAIFVFLIILTSIIHAYDLSPPKGETGWTLKSSGKDYKTYYRNKKGSDTEEVILVGVADRKPSQVISAITDYKNFPEFMPYVQFTKLVHSEKLSKDVVVSYLFTYLNVPIPLVSSRFYNLRYVDVYNFEGDPERFRSDWTLETGTYRKLPTDPGIRDFVTGAGGAVETTFNTGYFQIEPSGDPGKTKITYYVWTNPGGSLPSSAVNIANAVALPKLLKAISKRAGKHSSN